MKDKLKNILTKTLIIIFVIFIMNVYLNKQIFITKYTLHTPKTSHLSNFRMLQITDIHSIRNITQKNKLVNKIKSQNPDIIFVTGDLIDTNYYSTQASLYEQNEIDQIENLTIGFMQELVTFSDVYYIYGNHEMVLLDDPVNNPFKISLEKIGVKFLNNKTEIIKINNSEINLIGIQDPSTLYKDKKYAYIGENNEEKIIAILDDLLLHNSNFDENNFTILLSHRPEYFELYSRYKIDLAFTGHTHGGIIQLPLVGGIYTRKEGIFPKYTAGIYQKNHFQMILSRGIGYAEIPIRLFNPPEIVIVDF